MEKKKGRERMKRGISIFCLSLLSFVFNSSVVSVLDAGALVEKEPLTLFLVHVAKEPSSPLPDTL